MNISSMSFFARTFMLTILGALAVLASGTTTHAQSYIIDNVALVGQLSDAVSAPQSSLPGGLKFNISNSSYDQTQDRLAFRGEFKRSATNTRPLSLTLIRFNYVDHKNVAMPARHLEDNPLYTRLTIDNIVGDQHFQSTGFIWQVVCRVVLTRYKTASRPDTIQIKVLQVLNSDRGGPGKPTAVTREPFLIDATLSAPSRLVLARR